jgi:hypothetical protein
LIGLIYLPILFLNFEAFSLKDFIFANSSIVLVNLSLSAIALAMRSGGKGGQMHAIENGKTIIQTILGIFIDN